MKKILLAAAFVGFAIAQTTAQTPAPAAAKKTTATGVQATDPAMTPPQPAKQANVKPVTPAHKVAPASVKNGKPVMHKTGHGKKSKHVVKENKDAAKPMAPGTQDKK